MWGPRKWLVLLAVVSPLTLAQHSLDHAHLLLVTCWGEVYAISLPTTEDAQGLVTKLDTGFTTDVTPLVMPVGGPPPSFDTIGCWP